MNFQQILKFNLALDYANFAIICHIFSFQTRTWISELFPLILFVIFYLK